MTKTERFRKIADRYRTKYYSHDGEAPYAWFDTEPGQVAIDGHVIEIIESTNFNVDRVVAEAADPDDGYNTWREWVIVKFEGDLYRLQGIYDSWEGTQFEDWERVELRPVTTMEYVEVDNV